MDIALDHPTSSTPTSKQPSPTSLADTETLNTHTFHSINVPSYQHYIKECKSHPLKTLFH